MLESWNICWSLELCSTTLPHACMAGGGRMRSIPYITTVQKGEIAVLSTSGVEVGILLLGYREIRSG